LKTWFSPDSPTQRFLRLKKETPAAITLIAAGAYSISTTGLKHYKNPGAKAH
jgi:hypothetical protein